MKFTVFTPTYNRAHTLHRVYESLLEQTYQDFEWLVVDDGSSDGTGELIDRFQRCQSLFRIQHWRFDINRGKHRAHNLALEKANGEFLLVADSDDWITPNALQRMDFHWDRLSGVRDTSAYCGVVGLCADVAGRIIGTKYSDAMVHSTLSERKFVHKMKGEKWGSMRTDICRRYPFPDIDGFVPEGIVWLDIGKTYMDYCVNEVFRIYSNPAPLAGWHRLWNVLAS